MLLYMFTVYCVNNVGRCLVVARSPPHVSDVIVLHVRLRTADSQHFYRWRAVQDNSTTIGSWNLRNDANDRRAIRAYWCQQRAAKITASSNPEIPSM